MTINDEKTAVTLSQLRLTLIKHFSKNELHHLAFDLGIECEELSGSTRSDKIFYQNQDCCWKRPFQLHRHQSK